jgi:hypothetical protein
LWMPVERSRDMEVERTCSSQQATSTIQLIRHQLLLLLQLLLMLLQLLLMLLQLLRFIQKMTMMRNQMISSSCCGLGMKAWPSYGKKITPFSMLH